MPTPASHSSQNTSSVQSSYEVGYGKPPKKTQFKKGQSGNPRGRPKGSKNKFGPSLELMNDIFIHEAYRPIDIQDKAGTIRMPVAQAAMRSLGIKAAKGQISAQKLMIETLQGIERLRKVEAFENFEIACDYKKRTTKELEYYRRQGLQEPKMYPHPDDMELDFNLAKVIYHGPFTPDEKKLWDRLHQDRDQNAEALREVRALIREFEYEFGDDPEQMDEEAQATYLSLNEDLDTYQYLLATNCLTIMKRWTLEAKQVTENIVLRSLLDHYIKTDTIPQRPAHTISNAKIDYEKFFREFG